MRPVVICSLILSLTVTAAAQTNVSGTIPIDSTWSLARSPYVVIGNLTVANARTLTVDSGVVVRFQNNTGLYINGTIHARYAKFTSDKDTASGNPQKGDWNFIQIGDGYTYNGVGTFDTCVVKYGGMSSFPTDYGTIFVYSGSSSFSGGDISFSRNAGIALGSGNLPVTVSITNVNIFSCEWPVAYRGAGSLVFNGSNNLTGNTHNGIYMTPTTISNTVVLDTAPVPYVFLGTYTIGIGGRLDIASSNILKFGNGVSLSVNGALVANAGVGLKIYFTAYTDDNLGGDTNGDGSATAPAWAYWTGIQFTNNSVDSLCLLRRCKISFAGYSNQGGVTMANASPTIDSCEMANNYYGAMMQDVSNPLFSNNIIGSSQVVPIAMSFTANPILINNTLSFSDNRYDAIGLLGSSTPASGVLSIRSVTSIPNITYLLLEDVTIPVGHTLTINKGIVIKGLVDYTYWYSPPRIIVKGLLIANGTADSTIVFTSAKDDIFGNPKDTNKNGTANSPANGDWGGITFEGSSDTSSVLNYAVVKYGSLPNVYYNTRYIAGGAITTVNASPTISNCTILNAVYGIYAFEASKPKIWNDTLGNTEHTPIAMSVSADPSFAGDVFLNTAWTALGIIGENLGTNGTVRQRTVAGIANISYILLEDLTINSGTYVTVDTGVVIKCNNSGIFVNGGFQAKGSITAPIVFTSLKDDNFGNPRDSNGDGSATSSAPGDWHTIRFQGTSDDAFCVMDSCIVKFGGSSDDPTWGNVSFVDASGTLSHSIVTDSYQFGVSCNGNSVPHVDKVDIRNCKLDPIAMSLKADPVLTNITFTANGSKGIKILEGTLSSDAVLHQRNVAGITNVAYIVDYLTISSNAVLTIDPGVVIKFPYIWWNWCYIAVEGGLHAVGTPAKRIVFTSIRDDSNGGDTNNDGNTTAAARGDWWQILFTQTSNDTMNVLSNCDIRYGGRQPYYDATFKNWGMVDIQSSHVLVDSCSLQQSTTSGIGIYGSADPVIRNSEITNIDNQPISMSMFANPVFANDVALNVGYMALGIVPEIYSVTATVPVRDFGGYSNITYMLFYDYYGATQTVNSGTVITIPAGIVFKVVPGAGMVVNGGLVINGTAASPVIFTDPNDDSAGNPRDTNGNGSSTQPQIDENRAAITFNDVSDDSVSILRHVTTRYKIHGIDLQQASPQIIQGRFEHDDWGIQLKGVSNPVVDSCTFQDLTYAPLQTSLVSYPRSTTGNVIAGSTFRAIGIVEETLAQDVLLGKRNFAGINNIPYLFSNYTVGSGAVLTIQPGLVLKFLGEVGLDVHKGLIAEGGPGIDSVIVFTDFRDDFYGGDTNADSAASIPYVAWRQPGNWKGITFADESYDPLCRLSHCIIRYAWGSTWDGSPIAGITTISASPRVTYSSINNNKYGIVAKAASNPVFNYCDISSNDQTGLSNVDKSFTIDARWNWWGDNSGPTHSGNPGGTGQVVSDSVQYIPFLGAGALNPSQGDVSLNGSVDAFDASLILKYVVNPHGADSLNSLQRQVADVSRNGGPDTVAITAYDASLILQYVVELIDAFPNGLGGQKTPGEGTLKILALQKNATAGVSIENLQADRGTTVNIPVMVSDVSAATSFQAVLRYDAKVFTPVRVQSAGIALDRSFAYASTPGEIRFAVAGANTMSGSGTIAILTLSVSNDVQGTVHSAIQIAQFLVNERDISKEARPGSVEIQGRPTTYGLQQNYPNPFNPSTTITYQLPDDRSHVRIVLFNMLGQSVRTLVDEQKDAGVHTVVWDGRDNQGILVGSGVYLYRMTSGKFVQSKKLLLLK